MHFLGSFHKIFYLNKLTIEIIAAQIAIEYFEIFLLWFVNSTK